MHLFSFRSSLLICLLAPLCRGQSQAAAPPAASSPPPVHTHPEPVLLDQFVTSASPFGRNQIDLAQATTVLSGRNLLMKKQATLGETLAAETGMSATSFGPGTSRPIIRGLSGARVRLLENSVGTFDASVASPDHAVSIEPFLVERIEVVRGPASLLYGSSAVGGVVNVITHRVETELPAERARGAAELRYGSAADEWSRGGLLDFALFRREDRAVVLHVDGFRRSHGDMRIPGFAESARVRADETAEAAEHGEPAPDFASGRLPNSALDSDGGAVGLSFVTKKSHVGASYSGVNTNYGVPGHAHEGADGATGVRIDLRQRRLDVNGEWRGDEGPIDTLRLKLGRGDYRHAEVEPDGVVGTLFTNEGHDARIEFLHGSDRKDWSGAFGAQLTRSDFAASGEEAFLPPALTRSNAAFAFEEITRGPVTWQFGARLEHNKIETEGGTARKDRELSGSLGAIWKLDDVHSLALSLVHTGRAPNTQELFAAGPHAGTHSFEIGDATLDTEKSLGAELSVRRRAGFITGSATIFTNRFGGYIFEQATGQVAVETDDAWALLPSADPAAAESGDGLPVFRYVQRDARFWGAEIETLWHLHESTGRQFDVRLAAEFTRGREVGANLPRLPGDRLTAGVLWTAAAWTAGAESQFILVQKRTAPGEEASAGYALVSAHIGYAFTAGRVSYQFFARGSNLANKEARPHTSFVKDLAPLAGRALILGVRAAF